MSQDHATALVTGASSGIGEQFARQLAARGTDLVLVARTADRLEDLARQLRQAHGVTATVLPVDLAQPAAVDALVVRLKEARIRVDLLVNCAGFASYGPLAKEDPARAASEVQVNCGSLVTLTTHLLGPMLDRGHGGVLNVASTAAFQPVPDMAVYAATKAFVLSFTEAVWAETRGSGVRVLALCPGPTQTGFFVTAAGQDQGFLTRGRQSAEQVVTPGLHAFDSGRGPTVITGNRNKLLSVGYRVLPRAVMARVSQRTVAA